MQALIRVLLRYRNVVLIVFLAMLAIGAYAFLQLDIEAYPDPSPPMVEFITQYASWSAEEMEQQVTIPLETGLYGTPELDQIRSISIFGLSDVKMYFDFGSDYFTDRQEALNRLQQVTLPNNLQPQLSPESPVGEIYRYQLSGPGYSLNELKATQDWLVVREIKQVQGIIDVATFGGTTRQYQAEVDPNKLLTYGITMTQVVNAISNSNANAGGNYLRLAVRASTSEASAFCIRSTTCATLSWRSATACPFYCAMSPMFAKATSLAWAKWAAATSATTTTPILWKPSCCCKGARNRYRRSPPCARRSIGSTTVTCCHQACTSAPSTTARISSTSPRLRCGTSSLWG